MGMYTELVLKCDVKEDLPDDIKSVLEWLFNGADEPNTTPYHEFFSNARGGRFTFACSSYYHIPWSVSKYAENRIFSRSDIKNYSDTLELFLDWIRPYLDEYPEKCIGWIWYEEWDEPQLIYASEKKDYPLQTIQGGEMKDSVCRYCLGEVDFSGRCIKGCNLVNTLNQQSITRSDVFDTIKDNCILAKDKEINRLKEENKAILAALKKQTDEEQDRRRRVFEQVAIKSVEVKYFHLVFKAIDRCRMTWNPECVAKTVEQIISESDKFANKTQDKGE